MARTEVTKKAVAGFVEQVTDAGADRNIAMKQEFGPVMEEYMRENVWFDLIDLKWTDQDRVIEKINYKSVRDGVADFDPTSRNKGVKVKPEVVRVHMDESKDWNVEIYKKDYDLSNFPETSEKILASIFRAPESYNDDKVSTAVATESAANGNIAEGELDMSLPINQANGDTVYGLILEQLQSFIETGKDNDYVEGSKIPRDQISIAVSDRVGEYLVAAKRIYIDEAGLMNAGGFGTQFRNVTIKVAPEMPDGYEVLMFTKRAVAGMMYNRHGKFISADDPTDSYIDSANVVFDFGTGVVFSDEVTGLKTKAAAPKAKAAKKSE